MTFTRKSDILLNVCLPLSLGLTVYCAGHHPLMPSLVRNYLPDGLWAYAFISCILIIWGRVVSVGWVIGVGGVAAGFEVLQGLHIIPGTGDLRDVLAYFLAIGVALLFNIYLKKS